MIDPSTQKSVSFVGGNYFDKYRSKNPIHRLLMNGFLTCARTMLAEIEYESILEVGCGPGDLAESLFASNADYLGIDVDADEVLKATARYPHRRFKAGSAYDLPLAADAVDLVVACEVLEHLTKPELALSEIGRVSKEWILVSVPREPLWRILNFSRGKYWKSLGNTPGHVQHFSKRGLLDKLGENWDICKVSTPLPWTMVLARKRKISK